VLRRYLQAAAVAFGGVLYVWSAAVLGRNAIKERKADRREATMRARW
jgi:hypothetical protein